MPTETPTELSIAQIVGTLDAQATQDRLDETATATLWTQTATPNMTASIEAYRTEQAATTTQAWIASWTATPTPTFTPTNTPTATFIHTPNATTTLIAFLPPSNPNWTPVERDFDGVTMVLVPAGCFMMGSTSSDDEQPVHEQCFDAPFWMDKTEVTQSQFQRLGGVKSSDNRFAGADRPVERIVWFEAYDFCELRDARLPTEREWEYAARGPDNLLYPWGNEFIADNVVYSGNSNNQTAVVGSRPAGISWVGALDMSGNVLEWISSLYASYPYNVADGREADMRHSADVLHMLRGGSWYNNIGGLRAPVRFRSLPLGWDGSLVGFRCARSYE